MIDMSEPFSDSYFQNLEDPQEKLFGHLEFTAFLNPQAGSPVTRRFDFSGDETREATNEYSMSHFDIPILNFEQESEDSSYGIFQSFHEDQQTYSSQGSTATSPPSSYLYLNSPITSENTEINYTPRRKQIFRVIRSKNLTLNKDQDSPVKKRNYVDLSPRKTKQNKMKNFPGLITQRLKTKLTQDKVFRARIFYFVSRHLTQSQKEDFLQFVQEYCKDWKTWAKVSAYLNTDYVFGLVFQDIILAFLTESFNEDYEEWLVHGKMNEKSKELLRTCKPWFIEKFSSLSLDGPSDEDDYEFYSTTPLKKLKRN